MCFRSFCRLARTGFGSADTIIHVPLRRPKFFAQLSVKAGLFHLAAGRARLFRYPHSGGHRIEIINHNICLTPLLVQRFISLSCCDANRSLIQSCNAPCSLALYAPAPVARSSSLVKSALHIVGHNMTPHC